MDIGFISKTRCRATPAQVELVSAQTAQALAACMEDALLCIPHVRRHSIMQLPKTLRPVRSAVVMWPPASDHGRLPLTRS